MESFALFSSRLLIVDGVFSLFIFTGGPFTFIMWLLLICILLVFLCFQKLCFFILPKLVVSDGLDIYLFI